MSDTQLWEGRMQSKIRVPVFSSWQEIWDGCCVYPDAAVQLLEELGMGHYLRRAWVGAEFDLVLTECQKYGGTRGEAFSRI